MNTNNNSCNGLGTNQSLGDKDGVQLLLQYNTECVFVHVHVLPTKSGENHLCMFVVPRSNTSE